MVDPKKRQKEKEPKRIKEKKFLLLYTKFLLLYTRKRKKRKNLFLWILKNFGFW